MNDVRYWIGCKLRDVGERRQGDKERASRIVICRVRRINLLTR